MENMPWYDRERSRLIDVPEGPLPALPKGRIPRRGSGFHINALVEIEPGMRGPSGGGPEKENGAHVYRIIDLSREPGSWFYDYTLMDMETGDVLEKLYREAELSLLDGRESSQFLHRTGRWGGEEGSSERDREWDAKTLLVGRDDEMRDDETLRGD